MNRPPPPLAPRLKPKAEKIEPSVKVVMDNIDDARLYSKEAGDHARLQEKHLVQRSEFESYHTNERVELGFKQGLAEQRLRADQDQRSGEYKSSLVTEQEQLEKDLQSGGLRGWVRDLTGRNVADQEALENVQRSLDDAIQREREETQSLANIHAREEQQQQAYESERREHIQAQQRSDNDLLLSQQREQGLEVANTVTVSNENAPPKPAQSWEREEVFEQDNVAPVTPQFERAAQDGAPKRDVSPEISMDEQFENRDSDYDAMLEAYIADQQSYTSEPPQDLEAYIADAQADHTVNEPAQDFEQAAAPLPSHEPQR